jgi:hypothetical protein
LTCCDWLAAIEGIRKAFCIGRDQPLDCERNFARADENEWQRVI